MKKIYIVLALSVLFGIGNGVNCFAYDDGGAVNLKENSGGATSDPVRVYQLVRYPETGANRTTLSAGEVVIWDVISDDGVTVNSPAAVGITTSTDAVAGVVVSSLGIPTADNVTGTAVTDMGKRNWGYIQTYGLCSSVMIEPLTGGNVAAGQGLRASATRGYASASRISVSLTDAPGSLGFSYDAVATSPSSGNEAFIRTR